MAKKWPTPLSVHYFIFFYQSFFSKFHIWIVSIKLSLKFEHEFCPTKVNQDGQRDGRHLLVCTYRHSTLVIYYLIAAKFHIYFIPNKKRNAPLRTAQLSGRSQVKGSLVYISAKVCQVLLRYTYFAIRRRNCVKESWP